MSTNWTFLTKEEIKREFEYHRLGKTYKEIEDVGYCKICASTDKDLVGQSTTGGYTGMICIECLDKLNIQREMLIDHLLKRKKNKRKFSHDTSKYIDAQLMDFFSNNNQIEFRERINFISKCLLQYRLRKVHNNV